MMKAARRPLFWFTIAMWLLSFVISGLLIQLGGKIMSDVPTAGKRVSLDDFVDSAQLDLIEDKINTQQAASRRIGDQIEDAQLLLQSTQHDYQTQRSNFDNWIRTRNATQSAAQDPDVLDRIKIVGDLKLEERKAERAVEALKKQRLDQERARRDLSQERSDLQDAARIPFQKARNTEVLKVFMLRLALTLPLIAVSAWLIYKKRGSPYWPIFRGFIIFSLFAFFVELVPYLPSYGGYVRYIVGIALTVLVAHYLIKGMTRYVQRKKLEEEQPEAEKRKAIDYEVGVKKISSGVCPSCDRKFADPKPRKAVEGATEEVDFCVHCGFCLFDNCQSCGARENSFFKFCGSCGVPSDVKATG